MNDDERRAQELEDIHNEGQTDASNGEARSHYHSMFEYFNPWGRERLNEDDEAYQKGVENHEKRTKSW